MASEEKDMSGPRGFAEFQKRGVLSCGSLTWGCELLLLGVEFLRDMGGLNAWKLFWGGLGFRCIGV